MNGGGVVVFADDDISTADELVESVGRLRHQNPGWRLIWIDAADQAAGRLGAFQSVPLDGLQVHIVGGEITVVRNENLVDGRLTSPDFILRSAPVTPPGLQSFQAAYDKPIDATSFRSIADNNGFNSSQTLEQRLLTMLARLSDRRPFVVSEPALDIECEAWLEVVLANGLAQQDRPGEHGLPLRTPIGFWPRRRFDPDVDLEAEDDSQAPGLAVDMARRLRANDPAESAAVNARSAIAVRLYSGLLVYTTSGPLSPVKR